MAKFSDSAIRTYRTLRLAMVTVLVMLATSVLFEVWQTEDGCWQTSFSAYGSSDPLRSLRLVKVVQSRLGARVGGRDAGHLLPPLARLG